MKIIIVKCIKSFVYFGIAIMFSMIKFYEIDLNIVHPLTNENIEIKTVGFLFGFWEDVFEVSKSNWVFVVLFLLLGILELLEMKKHE